MKLAGALKILNICMTICYLIMLAVLADQLESGSHKNIAIAACVLAWVSEAIGIGLSLS